MNKKQLFKKYDIDDSHSEYEAVDRWNSVELYRIMNNGELPKSGESSILFVVYFLDKMHKDPMFKCGLENWGSLYLTAKRMVFRHSKIILIALKKQRSVSQKIKKYLHSLWEKERK